DVHHRVKCHLQNMDFPVNMRCTRPRMERLGIAVSIALERRWVERQEIAHNPEVGGSNPPPATLGPVTNVTGPLVFSKRRRETSAAFSFSTPVPPRVYDSSDFSR